MALTPPAEGDSIVVRTYEFIGPDALEKFPEGKLVAATVTWVGSKQFGFTIDGEHKPFWRTMLFDSTDWRYPK